MERIQWQYSNHDGNVEIRTMDDLRKIEWKHYIITIGLLENNKTYIDVSGSEVLYGERTVNYKVPFTF